MFYWNEESVPEFDLGKASTFVAFWKRFYDDNVTIVGTRERIDYLAELNIGSPLTEENVRRLLRWKDRRHLTDPVQSGQSAGLPNSKVANVLRRLDAINAFRQGTIPFELPPGERGQSFRQVTEEMFGSGIVWRAFLCHIARPSEYPILDKNVLNAFRVHTGKEGGEDWPLYESYKSYYCQIAKASGARRGADEAAYVKQLKAVDDALLAFGQFLAQYHRQPQSAV